MPSYLVTDIEANGLIPGQHSMISIASVAIDHHGVELDRFTINLDPVAGTTTEPGVMAWWATQPEARRLTTGGIDLPSLVMEVTGWPFEDCGRHHYPDEWLGGYAHLHRAIDDALGYAALLGTMLRALETSS